MSKDSYGIKTRKLITVNLTIITKYHIHKISTKDIKRRIDTHNFSVIIYLQQNHDNKTVEKLITLPSFSNHKSCD